MDDLKARLRHHVSGAIERGEAVPVREISNDDLWSAIRGIGMTRKTDGELRELISLHSGKDAFASQVIAEAARQVIAGGLNRGAQSLPAPSISPSPLSRGSPLVRCSSSLSLSSLWWGEPWRDSDISRTWTARLSRSIPSGTTARFPWRPIISRAVGRTAAFTAQPAKSNTSATRRGMNATRDA